MSEENSSDVGAFLAGFIIGGLVGAAAALILAPQSGQETRTQLTTQGAHLRDMSSERMHDYRDMAQEGAHKVQDQTRIVLDAGKSRLGHHEDSEDVPAEGGDAPAIESDAPAPEGDAGESA